MAAVAETSSSFSGGGWGERLQQRRDAENVDDPFEIVVQYPQGQFGFGFSQSLDQESGVGHQPFHRSKRMLGRCPPLLQRAGGARPARVFLLLLGKGSLEQAQRGAGRTAPAITFAIVAEPVTAEVLLPIRI